jgi:N-acetyl-gamma-glutamyl-phosphate reductase
MAKTRVFVDGQEGTTGLMIQERLAAREDVEILPIAEAKRKDRDERKRLMDSSDVTFLCLPDEASRESASLSGNPRTRILDASTAFRTSDDWAYGLPELNVGQRDMIRRSRRVSVPGCFATAFLLGAAPLVDSGIAGSGYPFTVHAVSGYSGGGKKLIAAYEGPDADTAKLAPPRHYALGLAHKHLPEMQKRAGLAGAPLFSPAVGPYYRGMAVFIPLHARLLDKKADAAALREFYAERYSGERFIRVMPFDSDANLDSGFLDPLACNGTNRADVFVFGHDDMIMVAVRIDNLGKGSSGAAIQCMNLMCGTDEGAGLSV